MFKTYNNGHYIITHSTLNIVSKAVNFSRPKNEKPHSNRGKNCRICGQFM